MFYVYILRSEKYPEQTYAGFTEDLIPSTGFGLQTSGNITNWVNVTNVPVLNLTNLENRVTVPKSSTNGFYRMRLTPG